MAMAEPCTRPKVRWRDSSIDTYMIRPTTAKAATSPLCSTVFSSISIMMFSLSRFGSGLRNELTIELSIDIDIDVDGRRLLGAVDQGDGAGAQRQRTHGRQQRHRPAAQSRHHV